MGKILEFLTQGKISVDLSVLGMRPIYAELMFTSLSIRGVIRVSKSFDPDQARCLVGPDLGRNCLQKLSADDTSYIEVKH